MVYDEFANQRTSSMLLQAKSQGYPIGGCLIASVGRPWHSKTSMAVVVKSGHVAIAQFVGD